MSLDAGISAMMRAPADAVAASAGGVISAVRDAAARTGTDFSFLLAQAKVESGLNAGARAATSSARGLFQFTKSTWLEMVQKHGADHGLGWAADALKSGAASAGTAAGRAARETILALRDHPVAASLMAGELVRDNAAALQGKLGRAVGSVDLYMAHFLGAGGAGKFLSALAATPDRVAADVVPAAAGANRSIFYSRDGSALSLAQVHAKLAGRLARAGAGGAAGVGGQGLPVDGRTLPLGLPDRIAGRAVFRPRDEPGATAGVGAVDVASNVAAGRARLAYMLLAEMGG